MAEEEKVRLGGMALGNGLLIHGPTHWSAAVRAKDGTIKVQSGLKPTFGNTFAKVPGLRGVVRLAEAMAVVPLVKLKLPAAKLPFEDGRILGSMALASAISAALRKRKLGTGGELGLAFVGLAPSLLALKGSQLAAYHGVEHKSIGAYEVGAEAADSTKEHERCGSNLVLPMMLGSIAGNVLVQKLVGKTTPFSRIAVSLGSAAVAVEMFSWSERHSDTGLAKAFRIPGTEIQRLFVTKEPTSEQMKVGAAALEEILRVEKAHKA